MKKFNKGKLSDIRRLVDLVLPYKGWIVLSVFCSLGYNLFTAAPGWYAKDIIDAIEHKPRLENFFMVAIGIVFVFTMKGVFFIRSDLQHGTDGTAPVVFVAHSIV